MKSLITTTILSLFLVSCGNSSDSPKKDGSTNGNDSFGVSSVNFPFSLEAEVQSSATIDDEFVTIHQSVEDKNEFRRDDFFATCFAKLDAITYSYQVNGNSLTVGGEPFSLIQSFQKDRPIYGEWEFGEFTKVENGFKIDGKATMTFDEGQVKLKVNCTYDRD